ncbi:MAG: Gfo/Idh/MocA family oxidoreductase [Clostridia bacterium]|nr:Gfo/Idh/MocA family oxidoreductase [Clostridia bacterium]
MYRIVMLGVENSHANNFLSLIADGRYPEIEVVGIYSDEEPAVRALNEKYGVKIMQSYDEAAGQVDGVVITARHGDNHYKYAKPYLPSGVPMFIDKPITCSGSEAVEFMREAKKYGVRVCGGSVCATYPGTVELAEIAKNGGVGRVIGGHVTAPLSIDSPYGGFYFYSQHLVQIMTTIFGGDVRAVCADRKGSEVSVLAKYDDFDVSGSFVGMKKYYYHGVVYGDSGCAVRDLVSPPDAFASEMDDIQALLEGKPMKQSYDEFIRPVFILNAIARSMETGTWADVNPQEV